MNLHNVRVACLLTLEDRRLSQQEFADKHALSHSWLNKFLRGKTENPRVKSVSKLEKAIEAEKRAS
jgi:transcriptional regulator with XRE-family HTH domain